MAVKYEAAKLYMIINNYILSAELSTREVGIKNYQGWNDEQLVVFDCQMRLAGYSFLGVYDFDEYILPKRANNLLEMLVRKLIVHMYS